jgi:Nidogen-like
MLIFRQPILTLAAVFSIVAPGFGAAIVPGFNATADGRNDDGTYTTGGCNNPLDGGTCSGTPINIGFNLNFFGVNFSTLYINTNGNVTLDAPLSTFTPFGLTATNRQIIAPFFADVDTRNPDSGVVTFGDGTFGGHPAFGVNWINVGYYFMHVEPTNSFQLLLVDRSDTGAGNFDIVFNYDNIMWETGDADLGVGGLGGDSARAGFSNGTGQPGTFFEFPGSAINGALINGGANALISHEMGSAIPGQYIFAARNGMVGPMPPPSNVPEPATWGTLGCAIVFLALIARR